MKRTIFFLAALTVLGACSGGNSKPEGQYFSAIESNPENDAAFSEENTADETQQKEQAAAALVTSLKFDKDVHDFGKIKTGSENKCVFVVTNTGKNPLIIEDVSASCGCTTPKKPEKPIPPGKSDVIEVGFKPNGPGTPEKTVTIVANTDPKISTVKVKATVD